MFGHFIKFREVGRWGGCEKSLCMTNSEILTFGHFSKFWVVDKALDPSKK